MVTRFDADRAVRRLKADKAKWCARPSNAAPSPAIRQMMKKNLNKGDLARAAANLDMETDWYAERGCQAVLDNEPVGWALLDRVLTNRWWHYRISVKGQFASKVALGMAHAITFHEDSIADGLAERLLTSIDSESYGIIGWDLSRVAPFLIKLWCTWRDHPTSERLNTTSNLGVYGEIFEAWENDAQLGDAVAAACDRHLSDALLILSGEGYPDFLGPYDLFPVEILALNRIRRELGMAIPVVEHPLLSTPLALPPPADSRPKTTPDPVLDEFVAKARKLDGSFA